ncbi:MAG: PIN domain-containing protein [Kineosporiaceae bacterium]|nr:PIN domain-containing protein [Kineosporiaceae bacterium]MBK7623113.1 PIN domain-containing protein [Kineosporiaceae bacterium]MBK8074936.1 PIN domain-containing protein [Kineosporiaceae bacterium]
MIIVDVNVLVTAHRVDLPDHAAVHAWLTAAVTGVRTVAIPDLCLTGLVRLVTNHRIFPQPTAVEQALGFCEAVLAAPATQRLGGGSGTWDAFAALVRRHGMRANDIPDTYLAALALEHRAVLATSDRGFARFADLKVLDPATAGVG